MVVAKASPKNDGIQCATMNRRSNSPPTFSRKVANTHPVLSSQGMCANITVRSTGQTGCPM
jgi:hypothetical protein